MRSHAEIVADHGTEKIAALRDVSIHTAQSWRQRDSIPAEHWQGLTSAGVATLEELATAAAAKPRARPTDPAQAAA